MSQVDEGKDEDDKMSVVRNIGQKLLGRSDSYTLCGKLYESVWKATGSLSGNVVVKSVNHFRLQNERDVLVRFQPRTPHIRPLLDEVDPDLSSHALIMRWLDSDLLDVTIRRQLASSEVKFVAKGVLEALRTLHADGYVHTDIKPSNVLVNESNEAGQQQITEVQLADFGSTVSQTSGHATDGDDIGTSIFRSPEAQLQMPWTTATDIWSFGIMIIDAIYGKGFHIMKPDVPVDHEDYDYKVIMRFHQRFGPFPWTFAQIADEDTLKALSWVMSDTPPDSMQPFHRASSKEICEEDKAFVLRILKLDPRDRPTATELLDDVWFREA